MKQVSVHERAKGESVLGRLVLSGVLSCLWLMSAASAALAATPAQISIAPSVQFPSGQSVSGFSFNPLYGMHQNVSGLDLGFVNVLDGSLNGVGLGLVNSAGENANGVQLSSGNFVAGDVRGLQLGAFSGQARGALAGAQLSAVNAANTVDGVQIGAYNWTTDGHFGQLSVVNQADRCNGVQIGLVNRTQGGGCGQLGLINLNDSGFLKFFPLFNFSTP